MTNAKKIIDIDEAIMRVDYILTVQRVSREIQRLYDDEYLCSPNLSIEDTKAISENLIDARKCLANAMAHIRPADGGRE